MFPPHRYHANEARSSSAKQRLMRADAFRWSAAADNVEKPPLCKIRLDQRRAEAGATSPAVSQEIKVFLFIFHSAPAWGEPCVWASRWTEMESGLFLRLRGQWTRYFWLRSPKLYKVLRHTRVNRLAIYPIRCGSSWINISDMAGLGARVKFYCDVKSKWHDSQFCWSKKMKNRHNKRFFSKVWSQKSRNFILIWVFDSQRQIFPHSVTYIGI